MGPIRLQHIGSIGGKKPSQPSNHLSLVSPDQVLSGRGIELVELQPFVRGMRQPALLDEDCVTQPRLRSEGISEAMRVRQRKCFDHAQLHPKMRDKNIKTRLAILGDTPVFRDICVTDVSCPRAVHCGGANIGIAVSSEKSGP